MDWCAVLRGLLVISVLQMCGLIFQCTDCRYVADKIFVQSVRQQVTPLFCRVFFAVQVSLTMLRLLAVFYFDTRSVQIFNALASILTIVFLLVEAFIFRSIDVFNLAIASYLLFTVLTLVSTMAYFGRFWIYDHVQQGDLEKPSKMNKMWKKSNAISKRLN